MYTKWFNTRFTKWISWVKLQNQLLLFFSNFCWFLLMEWYEYIYLLMGWYDIFIINKSLEKLLENNAMVSVILKFKIRQIDESHKSSLNYILLRI